MMKIKKYLSVLLLCIVFVNAMSQNWDLTITKNINPNNPSSDYWKLTSASTYFLTAAVPVGTLVTGFITNDPRLRRKSYEVFGAVVVELVITEAMKSSFDRLRPAEKYPTEIFPYKDLRGRSFPSGHTSMAFTAAASLSIQCKKWYITVPVYLWAGSVAYSRVYLGVHYASDVLGGAAVGVGSAYLTHWLNQKLFPVKKTVNSQNNPM